MPEYSPDIVFYLIYSDGLEEYSDYLIAVFAACSIHLVHMVLKINTFFKIKVIMQFFFPIDTKY